MINKNSILEVRDIWKSYGKESTYLSILKGLDLEVSPGEIVAVVGPSGSGKSTLLHVLGALEPPDKGEVLINGTNIWKVSEKKLSMIRNTFLGFVFQFHHLLDEFTLLENIALPCIFSGKSKQESMKIAWELVKKVGIEHRRNYFPSRVSGGERQRAAVARALICEPAVVLADEPTGNLDSENSGRLEDLLWKLAKDRNQAFVIATHSMDIAGRADRCLSMVDGILRQN